jgi:hypothetical protein
MKSNNLTSKESLYLTYTYLSISSFLVMTVSELTKNIKNVEKTVEFHPVVATVITINMIMLASFYFYKKNSAQRG